MNSLERLSPNRGGSEMNLGVNGPQRSAFNMSKNVDQVEMNSPRSPSNQALTKNLNSQESLNGADVNTLIK